MSGIVIKQKKGSQWEVIPTPAKFSEQIQALESFIGQQVVIEISILEAKAFVEGTEGLRDVMRKNFPETLHMTCEDALNMVEYHPLVLVEAARCYLPGFPSEEKQKEMIAAMKKEFGIHNNKGEVIKKKV